MRGVFTAFLVWAVACGGDGNGELLIPTAEVLRPGNAPDVVILSVAGHAGALSGVLCDSDDNRAYLGDPGDAVEAIASLFEELGFTVAVADFADRFNAVDADLDGIADDLDALGFLQLLDTIRFVHAAWIEGFDNPTRIVLVSHSHGTNWAHIAASLLPEVPIEYLVTLDGICFLWECEHTDTVRASGLAFAWDISRPCAAWTVPGVADPVDTKDVAFDNARVHLEVRSDDLFVQDCCDNVRLDGTRAGVETLLAGEDHSTVHRAASEAMAWVRDRIRLRETAP